MSYRVTYKLFLTSCGEPYHIFVFFESGSLSIPVVDEVYKNSGFRSFGKTVEMDDGRVLVIWEEKEKAWKI